MQLQEQCKWHTGRGCKVAEVGECSRQRCYIVLDKAGCLLHHEQRACTLLKL